MSGLILGLHPANERWRYFEMSYVCPFWVENDVQPGDLSLIQITLQYRSMWYDNDFMWPDHPKMCMIQYVMYALCVVYNPSNPHLALGPVCILVADSEWCVPIYMHEHWTVLNTDRNSNIVTLLFQAYAGSCYA